MRAVVSVAVPVLLALAACAHPTEGTPAAATPQPVPPRAASRPPSRVYPVPPDLVDHVEEARRLGRAIFLQDIASARATDVLLEAGIRDPRIRGWVTQDLSDGRWSVQFVMPTGDHVAATHEVRLWGKNPELEAFSPPRPLSPQAESIFLATRAVAPAVRGPCPGRYNPVVLPGSLVGAPGLLVYSLASTDRVGAVVLAGHHRFRVAADGRAVVDHAPLSRGCLIAPPSEIPPGSKVGGLVMNQPIADWPLETAVFTSLLHGQPIFLLTARGMWTVDGDEIVFLGN